MGQKEDDRKRYYELLSEGMKPSVALKTIELEHERSAETKEITENRSQQAGKFTLIGELKHLGREVGREVTEFPKRKLKEAAEDIETKRVYRDSYRKHKISAASSRGAEAEQRHHKEKVGREARRIKLEEERQKIALAAEKAARVERAKILTKQQYNPQGKRSQIARPEMSGYRSHQPYNMFTFEAARQFDPMGIYSFKAPAPRQAPNETKNQPDSLRIFELRGTPESANLWLSLVGYRQSSQQESTDNKKRQKRRVQNIFSGMWEWV